jgi:hypothetical protein
MKEIDREFIRAWYPDMTTKCIAHNLKIPISKVYREAYKLGLKKSEAFLKSEASGRITSQLHFGKLSQFKKGMTPWNKGKTGLKNTSTTKFKKGSLPHNTLVDGAITIRNDNRGIPYQFVRVALSKWMHLHVKMWIDEYGPIEKGMCVTFKDGNTMNCTIDNLQLLTRQENMKRNSIHQYPEEIKQTIRVLTKLKKTIANHGTQ